MNRDDFEFFVENVTYNEEPIEDQVEETHISWIAFSKTRVFKIKKPVKFSFLDFSTVEQRKKYCLRELKLNQRFSKIYFDVLPVIRSGNAWCLGEGQGEVVDYTVVMERMSSSKRMDKMLLQGKVKKNSLKALAKEVAFFHHKAEKIYTPFDLQKAKNLFNDIDEVRGFIGRELGEEHENFLLKSIEWSNNFLSIHASRIEERIKSGFVRDLHGDLHAGNIFLYRQPVLFDCIEFNDEYRHIDVLYEVAYLCMELEAGGHQQLSEYFLTRYSSHLPCFEEEEDYVLYQYFKCLRANVRLKVRALNASESDNGAIETADVNVIKNYLSLMKKLVREINNNSPLRFTH
jgi:aminoglycoside phosphotransferase family enzyme